jgi:hypothetical protein
VNIQEALEQQCWECKRLLKWNGFAGYEHTAACCGFIYTLKPRIAEYDFEVSKRQLPDGVIPGKDGGLFWHPI